MTRKQSPEQCILFRVLFITAFLAACIVHPAFTIELTSPDWEIVADGVSVSKPVRTSWGFVTVTDGRTLIGWTESGIKRFQQKLARKPSELLCADASDFIWHVSYDRQYLSLFNPDGVLQWEKKLDARCSAAPLVPGRDGRMFVALENAVICVDIHGQTVWSFSLEGGPATSLAEKADGTLICNGTLYLSPFGELLSSGVSDYGSSGSSVSGTIHAASCDFIISTGKSAITAIGSDGAELWSKSFAPEKVLFFEITDSMIITLSESWVIAGWSYSSVPSHPVVRKASENTVYDGTYGSSAIEKNYRSLLNGLKRIITVINRTAVNPSQRDVYHDMLNIRKAETSGFDFSPLLAEIILKENDPGVLQTALSAAAGIGRDPDGLVYEAIERRLRAPSFQFDDGLYGAFIDAVYCICITSGTAGRISDAKRIITPLVTLNNRTLIQKHAAAVLQTLIDMEE